MGIFAPMKKFQNYLMQLHIAFVLGVEPDLVLNSNLVKFCIIWAWLRRQNVEGIIELASV